MHAFEDDSAPRHPRKRGISASVRRERASLRRREEDDDDFDDEVESHDDESDDEEPYGLERQEEERQREYGIGCGRGEQYGRGHGRHGSSSSAEWVIRKGRGGKFVTGDSSSCTADARTQKKKRVEDDSWIVTSVTPGGPLDGSVIPSFWGHIARRIWEGADRKVLKCHNRHRACTTLQGWRSVLSDDIIGAITATHMGHLPYSMFPCLDMPLISAFVERWQPDTNSFHLPFGEMTIMLRDVFQILRIPVKGRMVGA